MGLDDIRNNLSLISLTCFLVATLLNSVASFQGGAPNYACRGMIPGHSNGSQTSPPPYRVDVSNTVLGPGERATVSVTSIGDFPFLGFICAASRLEDANHAPVGMMTHSGGFLEKDLLTAVSCSKSDPDTAMTHTSKRGKVRVEFDWAPPADSIPGQGYKMRCTVVQSFYRCWTGIQVNISIGQTATGIGSGNGGATGNNNNNNNINAILNFELLNPNPNQIPDDPAPSSPLIQNDLTQARFPDAAITQPDANTPELLQPSDILSQLPNTQNQFPSSSIPLPVRDTLSQSFPSFQNQQNDIFQSPNFDPNEIPAQTQSIDLGLLIDLINMGVITLQDGLISFNSIQSPTFNLNTNTITHDERFSPVNNQNSLQTGFSRQNSRTTFNENSRRSLRGPNSRGIFQSSRLRPFNPNFNRIRQPHIIERP